MLWIARSGSRLYLVEATSQYEAKDPVLRRMLADLGDDQTKVGDIDQIFKVKVGADGVGVVDLFQGPARIG